MRELAIFDGRFIAPSTARVAGTLPPSVGQTEYTLMRGQPTGTPPRLSMARKCLSYERKTAYKNPFALR
jgi:hypothetical protein